MQIGANEGSDLLPLITRFNLPALLVEPLPDKFVQLQANYASQAAVRFRQAAISLKGGSAEIFRPVLKENSPKWLTGVASLNRRMVERYAKIYGLNIESFDVPVLTMSELLLEHSDLKPLMFLQIGTEGYDNQVVESALQAGCRPRIIHYEHEHLSLADQTACRDLLAAQGYAFAPNRQNTIAYLTK